jgi:hypothetical protein
MPPDQHCIGLGVVQDGLAQPIRQLTLTSRVLNDRYHAVAVEAMPLNALDAQPSTTATSMKSKQSIMQAMTWWHCLLQCISRLLQRPPADHY